MDTVLYDISIPYISSLQDKFSNQADYMQMISVIFDPKYAFLIYSPLIYLLDNRVGKKLILTTVITEWLNMILKWLLHGERPYWYVHSSGHFNTDEINIEQFPITCELGPGHPSGHSMVTAAVWFIILDSIKQHYDNWCRQQQQQESMLSFLSDTTTQDAPDTRSSNILAGLSIWTSYALLLSTVAVSRVFLGCHFPHQCFAGALLGFCIAKLISKFDDLKAKHFVVSSLVLLLTAFGTFFLLQMLGLDPAWTIKLATKHCIKREYIHLDTAPFFSIMRYCGFALGTGLALLLPSMKNYLDKFSPVEATRLLLIDSPLESKTKTSQRDSNKGESIVGLGNGKASLTTTTTTTTDDGQVVSSELEIAEENLIDFDDDNFDRTIDEVKNPFSSRNLCWFSAKLLMALLMARLVDNLGLFVSHSNMTLFYSSAFLAYTTFSFTFINL